MKKAKTVTLVVCGLLTWMVAAGAPEVAAQEVFVTIGSGDFSGVYFPVGLTIARMVNAKRPQFGVRAAVEATGGSVFNINSVAAGYLEFGLVQSDKHYQAVNGLAEWGEKGPQAELRSVFSIHPEAVNLVAAVDAGIQGMADLKGKRVSLGNPGAGQYRNAVDALAASGIDPARDLVAETFTVSEALDRLRDNRIDAFFCTLGHPSEILMEAARGSRRIRFVPVTGPGIDRLIAENGFYISTRIRAPEFYPGAENRTDVETFGVIATLCTSSKVPADVVYALTKAVLDDFDAFKRQHPATADLSRDSLLLGLTAPLHPGALRYFREAGMLKQAAQAAAPALGKGTGPH